MNCEIIITGPAESDLEEIIKYISEELAAPQAAANFLDKVEKCYENIKNNPVMYERCRNERLKDKNYRK